MTHNGLEATFDMTVVPDYWAVTNARNANGGGSFSSIQQLTKMILTDTIM
ncbi:MAG: hypothetical protein R2769_05520 [Saprospiraceae bacterium]